MLQKREDAESDEDENWRPFILSISENSFERRFGFDMVRWIAHKYGFGTYEHFIPGYLNEATKNEAESVKKRLITFAQGVNSRLYLDTIISPSFTSAIAQGVQLPGVSGKGNNMILFEYADSDKEPLTQMVNNYSILKASELDICLLRSTIRGFGLHQNIHLWITSTDYENANLIILLGYVLLGHPEWKKANLTVFTIYNSDDLKEKEERMFSLIKEGRIPISPNNVQFIRQNKDQDYRSAINQHSKDADLTIVGFNDENIQADSEQVFSKFGEIGNIMFVNAHKELNIE